jgi:hypothetical protein
MKHRVSSVTCALAAASLAVAPASAGLFGSSDGSHSKHNKTVGCIIGGGLGALLGAKLLKGGVAGGVLGAGAGCAAGSAIAGVLTKREQKQLHEKTQAAFDEDSRSTSYASEDNRKTVTLTREKERDETREYEMRRLSSVQAPQQDDFTVVGRTYYAKTEVRLRSAPSLAPDNVIGSYKPRQAVFVMGRTRDRRWNVIGSDDVIVGYASTDLFSPTPVPARVAKTTPPAKPEMIRNVSLASADTSKVKLKATTSCADMRQSVGGATGLATGCKSPNGGWALS